MKENPYLKDFYSRYDEDGRLASRHGSVEYLTTLHYIQNYLSPGARVLEIGAGHRAAIPTPWPGRATGWTRWNWWTTTLTFSAAIPCPGNR